MNLPSFLACCLFSLVAATARAAENEPQESHVRGGLPNVAAKVAAGAEVRVAFLGGSITAAPGWRVFALESLRKAYPRVTFTEILAGVSGSGSDYGAARLARDVLSHHPDLLFVEFAVNDGGGPHIGAQMEGIVRQLWRSDAKADVCFVYTIPSTKLDALADGRVQPSVEAMEKVAAHYAIPTLNFGVEVARQMRAGTLVGQAPAAVPADAEGLDPQGRLIFTRDKVHPTPAGHRLYAGRLAAVFGDYLAEGSAGAHDLPPPLHADHWEQATVIPVVATEHDDRWSELSTTERQRLKVDGSGLVPAVWTTFEPGAAVTCRFTGNVLGIIGLKGSENGRFRVTVDDLPPQLGTLFDAHSTPGRHPLKSWFFSKSLDPGEHRVRLELLADPIDKAAVMKHAGVTIDDASPYAPHGLFLVGFIVNGAAAESRTPPPETPDP
ncbi:MAG: SGNH/GDSL hydrolase family protein [Planctomycetia bacterium]|nr:SGNH/GDSL hydrolase family protein [Planctomycetia bacterium]